MRLWLLKQGIGWNVQTCLETSDVEICDAIGAFVGWAAQVVDGGIGRSVTVSRSGFPDAVVWNPWEAKAKATGDFGDDEYKVAPLPSFPRAHAR